MSSTKKTFYDLQKPKRRGGISGTQIAALAAGAVVIGAAVYFAGDIASSLSGASGFVGCVNFFQFVQKKRVLPS